MPCFVKPAAEAGIPPLCQLGKKRADVAKHGRLVFTLEAPIAFVSMASASTSGTSGPRRLEARLCRFRVSRKFVYLLLLLYLFHLLLGQRGLFDRLRVAFFEGREFLFALLESQGERVGIRGGEPDLEPGAVSISGNSPKVAVEAIGFVTENFTSLRVGSHAFKLIVRCNPSVPTENIEAISQPVTLSPS